MNENKGEFKILICYTPHDGTFGYDLICEDGSPMEFVDGSQTTGFATLKDAIHMCVEHDYKFDVV